MAAKRTTSSEAQAWLARQLSDGQEHRIDHLLISGMMVGYSEQALRHAAHALHVMHHYTQDSLSQHGTFVECWQVPAHPP